MKPVQSFRRVVVLKESVIIQGMSREELLGPFPKVSAWMKRVAETSAPHHADASKILMKASAAAAKKLQAAQSKL